MVENITQPTYMYGNLNPINHFGLTNRVTITSCEQTQKPFVIDYVMYPKSTNALIWIPGFNDCFYHEHILKSLNQKYDLYVICLRDYQHLGKHDDRFYIDNVNKYNYELDETFKYIEQQINKTYDSYVLYGHSTGGLIATNYTIKGTYKNNISKLILNSPFFDLHHLPPIEWLMKNIIYYFIPLFPRCYYQHENTNISEHYRDDVHIRYPAPENKILRGHAPIFFGWIRAMYTTQHFLQTNKFNLQIPILIMYSNKTPWYFNKFNSKGDNILNVKDIDKYSDNLGSKKFVKEVIIQNAVHDVFCSTEVPMITSIRNLKHFLNYPDHEI